MKIAITGSIGSGKSTVSNYIRSLGYDVFDCDKVNSKLLEKGNLGYLSVIKAFPQVFDGENINKSELAKIVFTNKDKKDELEAILHPLIFDQMIKASKDKDVFIAEVPLLFEKDWDKFFDITILVVIEDDKALERLLNRGVDKIDAENRLKNQFSNKVKAKRADEIIYNNSNLNSLYKEIDRIIQKYVR